LEIGNNSKKPSQKNMLDGRFFVAQQMHYLAKTQQRTSIFLVVRNENYPIFIPENRSADFSGRLSAGETLGREPVCFHSFDISLASGPQ
jgi:hypothetical protein